MPLAPRRPPSMPCKSLTSSKSSSTQTTGVSQNAATRSILHSAAHCDAAQRRPRPAGAAGCRDIAGDHERAARGAEPVLGRIDRHGIRPSRSDALQDLFSQIDGDGDGKISKSEFENALGAGGTNLAQADDVFGKLDKNGDGSVSLDEMTSALQGRARAITITMPTAVRPARTARRIEFRSAVAGACRAPPPPPSPTATARPRPR